MDTTSSITTILPVPEETAREVIGLFGDLSVRAEPLHAFPGKVSNDSACVLIVEGDVPNERIEEIAQAASDFLRPYALMACVFKPASVYEEPEDSRIAIAMAKAAAEMVEKFQCGAPGGLDTMETVAQAVATWDNLYGVSLLGVSDSWLKVHFATIPDDDDALVSEIMELAPDIGTYAESADEITAFVERLRTDRVAELYWM